MTISSTTARNDYEAAGGTSFPYTFRILVQTELKVYVAGVLKTITTDYTVSGVGDGSGGSVDFLVAPTAGLAVAIVDEPDFLQETDYTPNDAFPASAHEDALDKLNRIVLYLKNRINQSLLLPLYSTITGLSLPIPSAMKFLRWNATETNLENANIESTGLFAYTDWGYAMMNSATSAAGLTNLGVSTFAQALLDDTTSATFQQSIGLGYVTQQGGGIMNLGLKFYPDSANGAFSVYALTATHATPTSAEPAVIVFPSTTSTGSSDLINLTSAISATISSGTNFGFYAGETGRIYVGLIKKAAGDLALAFARTAYPLYDNSLISTYKQYATQTTGTFQQKIAFTDTTYTNVPCRLVGYFEIQAAAATGTWDAEPSNIVKYVPGVRKSGEMVEMQSVYYRDTEGVAQDAWTPVTDLAIAVSPKSVCNKLLLRATVILGASGAGLSGIRFRCGAVPIDMAVARLPGSRLSATGVVTIAGAGQANPVSIEYLHCPNSMTSQTYIVESYASDATGYINRSGTDTDNNGYPRGISTFTVTEIEA